MTLPLAKMFPRYFLNLPSSIACDAEMGVDNMDSLYSVFGYEW